MKKETRNEIKKLLHDALVSKLDKYSPETDYKPFFQAIFSEEQILTHSIIQSFYTSFGMSIYEQIAVKLARGAGYEAERQYKLKGYLNDKARSKISVIHRKLQNGGVPNKKKELNEIRKAIKKGKARDYPHNTVDVYIKKPSGAEFYFDITTVKPNKKEFDTMKHKLLTWDALRLSQNRAAKVNTAVVIPYNPYFPKPYSRWTAGNMYDKDQLIVGKEFWDLVSGGKNYQELLAIFKEVGKELRSRIIGISRK